MTYLQPLRARRASSARRGTVVGMLTALVAVGAAQLIAAAIASPGAAPIVAVGELSIDHAPAAVKNFAISTFGSADKTVLVWGIRVVLIVLAAFIGILALRRLWFGFIGLVVLAGIGVDAALVRPNATASDALPSLVGAAAGALALWYFCLLARRVLTGTAAAADQMWPARGTDTEPAHPHSSSGQPPTAPAAIPDWRPEEPLPESAWAAAEADTTNRRKFLLTGLAAAAGSLIAYGAGSRLASSRSVSASAQALRLPRPASPAPPLAAGTDLKIPGLSPFITPNNRFYRVDTALVLPEILPTDWQLRVHGMVQRELVLSFDELIKRPLVEDYVTLCCVSNPVGGPYIGNAKWLGASLRGLLQEAGVRPGATQLLCTSHDGFTSGTPVATAMDGRDALLAVAMNNAPLPIAHGFPARLVIPGLYGYVSACKWIVDIEVTTYEAAQAYWVPRGWSAHGPIKTESRIDVPSGGNQITTGRTVTIAGVAWAQHKGIEAVEVRIANGPWQQARLAGVPGIDTWQQWAYEWHVSEPPGTYQIEARATDKTGYTQTSLAQPPDPNGASGYPSVLVIVAA